LPEDQQTAAFFRCWSRKEAFIKAVGEGLSYPLSAFEVALAPGDPPRLLSIRGSAEEARQWTLLSLELPAGYHGALAVKGVDRPFHFWRFTV
jgi:4'-phosphopantetheinyl transferase